MTLTLPTCTRWLGGVVGPDPGDERRVRHGAHDVSDRHVHADWRTGRHVLRVVLQHGAHLRAHARVRGPRVRRPR